MDKDVMSVLEDNIDSITETIRRLAKERTEVMKNVNNVYHDSIIQDYKYSIQIELGRLYCNVTSNSLEEFYCHFDDDMLESILRKVYNYDSTIYDDVSNDNK